jgi:hypothetical protein
MAQWVLFWILLVIHFGGTTACFDSRQIISGRCLLFDIRRGFVRKQYLNVQNHWVLIEGSSGFDTFNSREFSTVGRSIQFPG